MTAANAAAMIKGAAHQLLAAQPRTLISLRALPYPGSGSVHGAARPRHAAAVAASYARQANDEALLNFAMKIQARAIRRCGELLKEIPSATGAHLKQEGPLPLSRTEAATEAGLSEHQRKQALRSPKAVEPGATVTELAKAMEAT
jgi:hypothetical protein